MTNDALLDVGIETAYMQALKSFNEGGVPVGSALMIGAAIISVGHNQRVQRQSNILHGEMDCIEKAGHAFDLTKSVLFTTLSPCLMCANAILLFRIPRVVILDAENTGDFITSEQRLVSEGVDVLVHAHAPSIELNRRFQSDPARRSIWIGDVGR